MATKKETRKSLLQKIYLLKVEKCEINYISMDRWVKDFLRKKYSWTKLEALQEWYNRELQERTTIAF